MLTYEQARELFEYEPETGLLIRKISVPFAKTKAGSIVGSKNKNSGYLVVKVNNLNYLVHRIIWLHQYGSFPKLCVDHVNRDKVDNRLSNLREVTSASNSRNQGVRVTNTSGVNGVCRHSKLDRWVAAIRAEDRPVYLGIYYDFRDAVYARWQAEKKYGFPNSCTDSSAYLYLQNNPPQ